MAKEKFKMSKADLNKAWKNAIANKEEFSKGGGYDVYEDGKYYAAIVNAERGESRSSGRDQVGFSYIFLDGDYKGKTKMDFMGLDREESLPYIVKHIEALGFEAPEDFEELEAILKKITKARPKVKIVLKTKGEYQNVYFEKLLEEGDEGFDIEIPEEDETKPSKKSKEDGNEGKVSKETGGETAAEGEVKVGARVKTVDDDGEEEGRGEIIAIDEDAGEATVKLENGKKVIVDGEHLRLLPKEEAAPKKKGLTLGKK